MFETEFKTYGGLNSNPRPFLVGDIVQLINGDEKFEITGYEGDSILMQPLSNDEHHNPVLQLHYKYADTFIKINI